MTAPRFQLLAALALFVSLSQAQQLATVTGRVGVAGADIQLSNSRTRERHTTNSNSAGVYSIGFVKPGRYTIVVEAEGYGTFERERVEVRTGATVRVDAQLKPGDIEDSARATPLLLDDDEPTLSSLIENRSIIHLPLEGRRAAQLARLGGFTAQRQGTQLQIGGGRSDNAFWGLDGGSVQDNLLGVANLQFDPPIEALNEVRVQASSFRSEIGRTGGAAIQMTSVAGTNGLRGVLYEYLRNDALDTRQFFEGDKEAQRGNQFGFALSGPIRKNRTFFSMSGEWIRRRSSQPRIENIPDPAETRGDFSMSEARIRTPNRVIPASELDPVGLAAAELWPDPNLAGRPSRQLNYLGAARDSLDNQTLSVRLDHALGANHRLFGRYGHALTDLEAGAGIWPDPVHRDHRLSDATYFNGSLTSVSSFGPKLSGEVRFTANRRKLILAHASARMGLAQRIGFTGANPDFFPGFGFTGGVQGIGRLSDQERLQDPIRDTLLATNWSYSAGKHALKWGGELRSSRTDDASFSSAGGALRFGSFLSDPVAALVQGSVWTASREETFPLRGRAAALAAYVQDDWKIGRSLTLNLGLRYDLDTPRWEAIDNRQNSFDRAAVNPVCGCPGTITFSGRDARGGSRYAHNFARENFGPRIGFAYRPADRWVIRGGGGVVFIGQYDQATSLAANAGFSIRGSFPGPISARIQSRSTFQLRDGMPDVPIPTEADLTPSFGEGSVAEFFQPEGRPNPYLISYSFNVQRRLTASAFIEAGYLATLGRKLTLPGSATLNQIHPNQIQLVDDGVFLRPFSQFSDVRLLAPNFGSSAYHGFNLRIEKRYSNGLVFGMNYTFARALDNVNGRNELGGDYSPVANQYDRRSAWGLSGGHVKHRWIAHTVWDVPYGKRRENEFSNRWLNHLIGGWTIGAITELRSGAPFGASWLDPSIYPTADRIRADIDGPYLENRSWRDNVLGEAFFDTSSFARPERFTFGNVGRNAFIGPGAVRIDVSLIRRLYWVPDSQNLQLRAEVFNLPNHANFGQPVSEATRPDFGRITTLAPGAAGRRIQVGVRYAF